MTIEEHHLLCLGVLAGLLNKSKQPNPSTVIDEADAMAIRQAVSSAEKLGLPVSAQRLSEGLPIFKTERN